MKIIYFGFFCALFLNIISCSDFSISEKKFEGKSSTEIYSLDSVPNQVIQNQEEVEINKANLKDEHQNQSINNDYTIELKESFTQDSFNSEYIGEKHFVNIANSEFVFLSAYSLNNGLDTELSFRIENSGNWSEWMLLPEDSEIVNNERTIYKGPNIFNDFKHIQFKSSKYVSDNIVFRLYIASN